MNVKLIALMFISAGLFQAITADITPGTSFETDDDTAGQLIGRGLAKLDTDSSTIAVDPAPAARFKKGPVRLLMDGPLGKANDVVILSAADARAAKASGQADNDEDAVAYAAALPQNQTNA